METKRLPGGLRGKRLLGLVLLWGIVAEPSRAPAQQPPPAGLAAVAAIEQATVSAIEQAEHSVVAISRWRRDRAPNTQLDPLRSGLPFTPQDSPDSTDFVPTLFGSGVVISADGYIVTCAHVLDDPRVHDYYVWLDQQSYPARVIGRSAKVLAADPFSDLAVLKIDAANLTPIRFGDAESLRKGQFVIALGNPAAIARDGEASASWGIISNLKRFAPAENEAAATVKETLHQLGTLIQTDAKLNLGTSGGALINLQGEMVGLTTSLAASSGYEQAAGFAIAVDDTFERVVESLKLGNLPDYGFLGIQPEDLRALDRERGLSGAKVSVVIPGLPGDQAGLRPEDIIVEVGDEPIANRNDLFRELSRSAAGTQVTMRVQRFRPGTRIPEMLTLRAELSKKFVATSRPGFAVNANPSWRGLQIEYATAVPSELARSGILSGRRGAPKLAVLAVEPDTAAWKAGLRPGFGVISVDGVNVETPEAFVREVAAREGAVTLGVVQMDGRAAAVTIPAVVADE